MDETPHAEGGMLCTVTRIFQTLRDVVSNRMELFLLEVKEERVRLFEALMLAATVVVCASLALIMVTLTVAIMFWDTHRLLVLTLVAVAYLGGALVAFARLRCRLRHWQAYSATLEQLRKDCACLKKEN